MGLRRSAAQRTWMGRLLVTVTGLVLLVSLGPMPGAAPLVGLLVLPALPALAPVYLVHQGKGLITLTPGWGGAQQRGRGCMRAPTACDVVRIGRLPSVLRRPGPGW